jgi:signal transduction histidine kinase
LDAYARTVAHDLKNPVASLTGIAEILAENYLTIPAEKLGGKVAVEGEGRPGQGSTFSFTLPLDRGSDVATQP